MSKKQPAPDAEVLALAWPASAAGEMLVELARRARVPLANRNVGSPPSLQSDGAISSWLAIAAAAIGLEATLVRHQYREIPRTLAHGGPLVIRLPTVPVTFLAVLRGRRASCLLLAPGGRITSVSTLAVRGAMVADVVSQKQEDVDALLAQLNGHDVRTEAVVEEIIEDELHGFSIDRIWTVRPAPVASLWTHLRFLGVPGRALAFTASYAVQYALWLLSWWIIGSATIRGVIDRGWIAAWILVLITIIPLQALGGWLRGVIGMTAAAVLKRRILFASTELGRDSLRAEGASHVLGRAFESHAIETGVITGLLLAIVGLIELGFAAAILQSGAGGWLHVAMLVSWVFLQALLAWASYRRKLVWTAARLGLGHDAVEKMIGYRTRVAQEPSSVWHEQEDRAVAAYADASHRSDSFASAMPLLAQSWIAASLAVLIAVAAIEAHDALDLALALGGILLAGRSLSDRWGPALSQGVDAAVAWHFMRRFLVPVRRAAPERIPDAAISDERAKGGDLLVARDVTYAYPDRPVPVLANLSLTVAMGDRILLEGASGSGKSTIAALLTKLAEPSSGTILVQGLDSHSLGRDAWLRRVVAAPQFHENHLFSETLAFNLLMGRRWPPTGADLREARTVCSELGLDRLLARMPAGIFQLVGDTGWQLSHGERSRVFIARALLQGADVVILDESFAALDSANFERSLACVLSRAPAVIAIAHP